MAGTRRQKSQSPGHRGVLLFDLLLKVCLVCFLIAPELPALGQHCANEAHFIQFFFVCLFVFVFSVPYSTQNIKLHIRFLRQYQEASGTFSKGRPESLSFYGIESLCYQHEHSLLVSVPTSCQTFVGFLSSRVPLSCSLLHHLGAVVNSDGVGTYPCVLEQGKI